MDAPPVQYVTTSDGYRIAYAVSGSGPPLILMPLPINHIHLDWEWRPSVLCGLAERFQLIQYDHRGQGLSQRGLPPDLRIEHYTLDIEAIVKRLGPGPFLIWAAGSQVLPALNFTIQYPEMVRGLILRGVTMRIDKQVSNHLLKLAETNWETFLNIMRTSLLAINENHPGLEAIRQAVTQADWLTRAAAFEGLESTSLLPKLECPTVIMTTPGSIGPALEDLENAQQAAALIQNARLIIGRADPTVLPDVFDGFDPQQAIVPTTVGTNFQTGLSARELDVVRLIATGRSNQQIADELVISLNTARKHVANILDKTGTANRTEAAGYARDHGFV